MQSLWNEICYLVNRHKNNNVYESLYQNEFENILEKLGWSRMRGEIVTQDSVPVGSASKVVPDIILSTSEGRQFVIELKRPTNNLNERNAEQLFSYMRLLKLPIGFLIGASIKVFFEPINSSDAPVMIKEIDFVDNNPDGVQLISLIHRNYYNFNNFYAWGNNLFNLDKNRQFVQQVVNWLCGEDGNQVISNLLWQKLNHDYTPDVAQEVYKRLNISINPLDKSCETKSS